MRAAHQRVPAALVTLVDLVRGARAGTGEAAHERAFLPADEGADARAGRRRAADHGGRLFPRPMVHDAAPHDARVTGVCDARHSVDAPAVRPGAVHDRVPVWSAVDRGGVARPQDRGVGGRRVGDDGGRGDEGEQSRSHAVENFQNCAGGTGSSSTVRRMTPGRLKTGRMPQLGASFQPLPGER